MFSLSRALRRIHLLGLSNVEVNNGFSGGFKMIKVCIGDVADLSLGNFEFDVGVGLHFCGMLTDLALSACLDRKASFAFVPCCYGKVGFFMIYDVDVVS